MLSLQIPFAIGGAVIAHVVWRQLASARRADPRDEIRNELESLRGATAALPAQMHLARRSRMAVAEAKGLLGNETTGLWLSELQADLAEAELVAAQVPSTDICLDDHSVMGLEIRLAEILALSIRANRLAEKYRLSLCADAAGSERLSPQAESPAEPTAALQPSISLIAPS
jgi:hypothetical protein